MAFEVYQFNTSYGEIVQTSIESFAGKQAMMVPDYTMDTPGLIAARSNVCSGRVEVYAVADQVEIKKIRTQRQGNPALRGTVQEIITCSTQKANLPVGKQHVRYYKNAEGDDITMVIRNTGEGRTDPSLN